MNTTDPAFGGSGANLPFEFVQEVEIKTGAYGAEYGKATGGIFNVITKSGSNEFHGDIFGYGTTKGLVRSVKNFPFTGSAANGFSEADIGGDIGGPIIKDKLWFFGAFNPQRRSNFFLTQTFHAPVENKVTIPFYAGKITWALNSKNTLTGSTFGDYTKAEGFLATYSLANVLTNVNGFGDDVDAFLGTQESGGQNYAIRLNSTIRNNFIAEFSGGLHFQRNNVIPRRSRSSRSILDNFAVLRNGSVLTPVQTGVDFQTVANANGVVNTTGFIDFVDGRGGSLQRNFSPWSGLWLVHARRIATGTSSMHTCKTSPASTRSSGALSGSLTSTTSTLVSSGQDITYANPLGLAFTNGADVNQTHGSRITNNWLVCTVRDQRRSFVRARRALNVPRPFRPRRWRLWV